MRAGELRNLLFTFGGLNLTKATLERFLGMGEVEQLLSDELLKSRQELTDAKTATAMLKAATHFLNEMLAATGRRTDAERNAFWTGVVELMPPELTENRQGRSLMRIVGWAPTGSNFTRVKQGLAIRKALEDSGKGWVLLETKTHSDSAAKHVQLIQARRDSIRVHPHAVVPPSEIRSGVATHERTHAAVPPSEIRSRVLTKRPRVPSGLVARGVRGRQLQ